MISVIYIFLQSTWVDYPFRLIRLVAIHEEEHWTVSAYGKKDRGFLVITKIDKQYLGAEKNIIDLMWETLQIES